MIKEFIVCIVSIIIIITGNILTQNYTNSFVSNISNKLENLRETIAQKNENEIDKQKAKEQIDDIFNCWNDNYVDLAYFIEHDELEKVITNLTELRTNMQEKQFSEATVSLDKAVYVLGHIQNKIELKLENIF